MNIKFSEFKNLTSKEDITKFIIKHGPNSIEEVIDDYNNELAYTLYALYKTNPVATTTLVDIPSVIRHGDIDMFIANCDFSFLIGVDINPHWVNGLLRRIEDDHELLLRINEELLKQLESLITQLPCGEAQSKPWRPHRHELMAVFHKIKIKTSYIRYAKHGNKNDA